AVAFQNRGPVLASGAPDGKVGFWCPGVSDKALAVVDFGEGVSRLAWSPGDGRLGVGGEVGAVAMYTA
ncbi:MAG TPA: WD40 repeat domain-containing protein, partial [Gemmataceae bacterium]|nr:WD40 repeat domain-containing protein [Gemmataceae bacterium]